MIRVHWERTEADLLWERRLPTSDQISFPSAHLFPTIVGKRESCRLVSSISLRAFLIAVIGIWAYGSFVLRSMTDQELPAKAEDWNLQNRM